MRWSTVCGEIPSSVAISLDDRCWSTRRRQSSCPSVSFAILALITSSVDCDPSLPGSGTRNSSFKTCTTPYAMAPLPSTSLDRAYVISRLFARFRAIPAISDESWRGSHVGHLLQQRMQGLVERAGFEPAYACAGRFTVCCL